MESKNLQKLIIGFAVAALVISIGAFGFAMRVYQNTGAQKEMVATEESEGIASETSEISIIRNGFIGVPKTTAIRNEGDVKVLTLRGHEIQAGGFVAGYEPVLASDNTIREIRISSETAITKLSFSKSSESPKIVQIAFKDLTELIAKGTYLANFEVEGATPASLDQIAPALDIYVEE
ncbi:MAG: hypothetical protein ACD_81C00135G0010 [uncultured bacterium]|uniref:Uncharacterized protein n=2 Tax=Candidatus Wolfeibacteriota TaxID=1752735 RepID=A0A0G1JGT3_9BACT|nr:MAG: hypothetical protein ACD_81C00135G0010 [uncultured bacterium]KKR12304.1 MAG: hypothetical protein UT41_C0002G0078 [Candidatus Wolfebacteria bacterium GW2011_GWC2_39_22]KKT43212.1 MAG: hypothetical protein UW32_C0002G0073 [Candidatus Wolfebacteria bacterium GW2011_GWE2_44_13]HBI25935.1 hypothetical protein [Candidatus Wolfebacteria bacterium]